jgi:cytochrome bd-type quinol oxidase subunit 1
MTNNQIILIVLLFPLYHALLVLITIQVTLKTIKKSMYKYFKKKENAKKESK